MAKLKRDKGVNTVTVIALLIFAYFIYYAIISRTLSYIMDSALFIALTIFFYCMYKKWNFTLPIYIFVLIPLIAHNAGVLGYYNKSPVPIQWDHITHFLPMFGFSLLFFQNLKEYMNKKFFTSKNFLLFLIVLFGSIGIGSLIENAEFFGYLAFGFGEGGFMFGAGDGLPDVDYKDPKMIEFVGGGWFNTMWDIVFNELGALTGLVVMMVWRFGVGKR